MSTSDLTQQRARVRELRIALAERHAKAQQTLDAAEWNLRQLQKTISLLRENRDFMVKELEDFDQRHQEWLP